MLQPVQVGSYGTGVSSGHRAGKGLWQAMLGQARHRPTQQRQESLQRLLSRGAERSPERAGGAQRGNDVIGGEYSAHMIRYPALSRQCKDMPAQRGNHVPQALGQRIDFGFEPPVAAPQPLEQEGRGQVESNARKRHQGMQSRHVRPRVGSGGQHGGGFGPTEVNDALATAPRQAASQWLYPVIGDRQEDQIAGTCYLLRRHRQSHFLRQPGSQRFGVRKVARRYRRDPEATLSQGPRQGRAGGAGANHTYGIAGMQKASGTYGGGRCAGVLGWVAWGRRRLGEVGREVGGQSR